MRKDARSRTKKIGLWLGLSFLFLGAVLLLPQVQLSLLSVIDKRLEAVSLQASALHIAPWGLAAEDVSIALPGLAVEADQLKADIALMQSLLRRRLVLTLVHAEVVRVALEPALLPDGASEQPESMIFSDQIRRQFRKVLFKTDAQWKQYLENEKSRKGHRGRAKEMTPE